MKTLKLLTLATLTMLFSQCKSTAPTAPLAAAGHLHEIPQLLDTLQGKFYELAQSNRSSTPQQVLVMTADWVKTQPNVAKATWFDSSYINIKMKSGLRTMFIISPVGTDGIPLTRGGNPHGQIALKKNKGTFAPLVKANNEITNKKVLLFEPFSGCGRQEDFYTQAQLDVFVNLLSNSGRNLEVNLLRCGECTINAVESFGKYGLVIMETHGLPDGFLSGQYLTGLSKSETSDADIKMHVESALGPNGYDGILNGYFFLGSFNLVGGIGWQDYTKTHYDNQLYRVIITSEFINSLPAMPNTIVFGNMCYSGWSKAGTFEIPKNGEYTVNVPIQKAFMGRDLLSYYAYAYNDGTSTLLGNLFAEHMMDTMLHNLVVKADSTGHAFLKLTGSEFIGSEFFDTYSPNLLFKHFGADDYSYDGCGDSITDSRDGQKYATVCIGKQTWMAENLRYNAPGSVCYDNNSSNCDKYGRLYDWQTAMGSGVSSSNPSGVQGICPKGWHLPSKSEWDQLAVAAGGTLAGENLKSTTDWVVGTGSNKGTDKFGFTALPGGYYEAHYVPIGFNDIYGQAHWWSTDQGSDLSYRGEIQLSYNNSYLSSGGAYGAENKVACRCLKD